MHLTSLKNKLLLAVSCLVIGSGLCISLLVSRQYHKSLHETMTAEAENLAFAVALEAADKVLINDLIALQKMLDHQMRSHLPAIVYLFVLRDGEILAHTFPKAVPTDLVTANTPASPKHSRIQKIASIKGEYYLDVASPIFEGKAGVLRLGLSEDSYDRRLNKLWLEMTLLTLGILLLALIAALLFVRRITNPIESLAQATMRIDQGETGVRVSASGEDEVGRLAASFNKMVARLEDSSRRLEEKARALERANQQTQGLCRVIQEIGELRSLKEIGAYLNRQFQGILGCGPHMVYLFLNNNRTCFFALFNNEIKVLEDSHAIGALLALLDGMKKPGFVERIELKLPLVPSDFQDASRYVVVPLEHEGQNFGALIVACPETCVCDANGIESVDVILSQAAGVINRAVLHEEEMQHIQRRLETSAEFSGIVGRDIKMQVIYKLIEDIAPTDATVLIQGESGTGKEVVARAIHEKSPRNAKPFVVINCSAYPATLLESELFGHEKGAFTGATRQKPGRFEQAHGGTVFLDEIGEIPFSAQIKLLRVLQTQNFERLGAEKTLAVNVRVVAATNKDLLEEVKGGRFREDLFYRLNVIPIHLPPLRERRNDIPLLSRHFLRQFAAEQGKEINEFSPDVMRKLLHYSWPGNVRELENTIEHAVVLTRAGRVEVKDLPAMILQENTGASFDLSSKPPTMAEKESELLKEALEKCNWNKKEAARRLGISRNTLYAKMRKYRISTPTTH